MAEAPGPSGSPRQRFRPSSTARSRRPRRLSGRPEVSESPPDTTDLSRTIQDPDTQPAARQEPTSLPRLGDRLGLPINEQGGIDLSGIGRPPGTHVTRSQTTGEQQNVPPVNPRPQTVIPLFRNPDGTIDMNRISAIASSQVQRGLQEARNQRRLERMRPGRNVPVQEGTSALPQTEERRAQGSEGRSAPRRESALRRTAFSGLSDISERSTPSGSTPKRRQSIIQEEPEEEEQQAASPKKPSPKKPSPKKPKPYTGPPVDDSLYDASPPKPKRKPPQAPSPDKKVRFDDKPLSSSAHAGQSLASGSTKREEYSRWGVEPVKLPTSGEKFDQWMEHGRSNETETAAQEYEDQVQKTLIYAREKHIAWLLQERKRASLMMPNEFGKEARAKLRKVLDRCEEHLKEAEQLDDQRTERRILYGNLQVETSPTMRLRIQNQLEELDKQIEEGAENEMRRLKRHMGETWYAELQKAANMTPAERAASFQAGQPDLPASRPAGKLVPTAAEIALREKWKIEDGPHETIVMTIAAMPDGLEKENAWAELQNERQELLLYRKRELQELWLTEARAMKADREAAWSESESDTEKIMRDERKLKSPERGTALGPYGGTANPRTRVKGQIGLERARRELREKMAEDPNPRRGPVEVPKQTISLDEYLKGCTAQERSDLLQYARNELKSQNESKELKLEKKRKEAEEKFLEQRRNIEKFIEVFGGDPSEFIEEFGGEEAPKLEKYPETSQKVPEVSKDILEVSKDIPEDSKDIPEDSDDIPEVSENIPEVFGGVGLGGKGDQGVLPQVLPDIFRSHQAPVYRGNIRPDHDTGEWERELEQTSIFPGSEKKVPELHRPPAFIAARELSPIEEKRINEIFGTHPGVAGVLEHLARERMRREMQEGGMSFPADLDEMEATLDEAAKPISGDPETEAEKRERVRAAKERLENARKNQEICEREMIEKRKREEREISERKAIERGLAALGLSEPFSGEAEERGKGEDSTEDEPLGILARRRKEVEAAERESIVERMGKVAGAMHIERMRKEQEDRRSQLIEQGEGVQPESIIAQRRREEEERRKAEEDDRKAEEERKREEEDQRRKVEEDDRKVEEDDRKVEEDDRKVEEDDRKAGEEGKRGEEDQRRREEEDKQLQKEIEEYARKEEERRNAQQDAADLEQKKRDQDAAAKERKAKQESELREKKRLESEQEKKDREDLSRKQQEQKRIDEANKLREGTEILRRQNERARRAREELERVTREDQLLKDKIRMERETRDRTVRYQLERERIENEQRQLAERQERERLERLTAEYLEGIDKRERDERRRAAEGDGDVSEDEDFGFFDSLSSKFYLPGFRWLRRKDPEHSETESDLYSPPESEEADLTAPVDAESPPDSPTWLNIPPPDTPPIEQIHLHLTIFTSPTQYLPDAPGPYYVVYRDVPLKWNISQLKRFLRTPREHGAWTEAFPGCAGFKEKDGTVIKAGSAEERIMHLRIGRRWLKDGSRTLRREGFRDWESLVVIMVGKGEDVESGDWKECVREADGVAGWRWGWPGTGAIRTPEIREGWCVEAMDSVFQAPEVRPVRWEWSTKSSSKS